MGWRLKWRPCDASMSDQPLEGGSRAQQVQRNQLTIDLFYRLEKQIGFCWMRHELQSIVYQSLSEKCLHHNR